MTDTSTSQMESVYVEKRVIEPSKEFVDNAHIKSMEEYKEMYDRSINDPQGFWGEMAEKHLEWFKKWPLF